MELVSIKPFPNMPWFIYVCTTNLLEKKTVGKREIACNNDDTKTCRLQPRNKKLNVAKIMTSIFDRVKSIVIQEENAGNLHFLLFPQCFKRRLFHGG